MTQMILMIVWAVLLFILVAALHRFKKSCEELLETVRDEISRMWDRIEWLCRDTDDRLSVDRLEFQQKSKQIRNLWKRLRYVEKRLYIELGDAFKEKEDDGQGEG